MDRFLECLAVTLTQETGYPQPAGGPYARLADGSVYDERAHKLRNSAGLKPMPTHKDGMAFDDDPRDTGGRTGMGILQREYTPYCIAHDIPKRDVWQIADTELEDLYRAQFWEAVRADDLPPGIDLEVFDTAVNCGVSTAIARLQLALGVKVDRHLGAVTIGALQGADIAALVEKFNAERVKYYRQCRTYPSFGRDWLKRAARLKVLALHDAARHGADGKAFAPAMLLEAVPTSPARAEDDPLTSMSQSTTGNTALAIGGGSTIQIATKAAAAAAAPGVTAIGFALEMAQDPMVVTAAVMAAGAAYIWFERQRHMREGQA